MMICQKLFFFLTAGCVLSVSTQFIYLNSGVFKFISGIGLPLDVKISGGSMSWFTNFQVFYQLPDNITYFEPYRIVQKRSIKNTFNRLSFYQAFGKYIKRLGFSGNECIYRLICEIGSREINNDDNGLFGEILHILFSPETDMHNGLYKYKTAQRQGSENGTLCEFLYKDCYVNENSILFNNLSL